MSPSFRLFAVVFMDKTQATVVNALWAVVDQSTVRSGSHSRLKLAEDRDRKTKNGRDGESRHVED